MVEQVVLPKTNVHSYVQSYLAWSIKRVKVGCDDAAEVTKADGTKVKAFNFSGRLDTLPDLRNALETLRSTAVVLKMPTLEELVQVKPGPYDIIDLIPYYERQYTVSVKVARRTARSG